VSTFIGFLIVLHMTIGRMVVAILPLFWAYNVAQRGESFGYALFTYFGNAFLLGLLWGVVYWLLEKISIGVMFSGRR
jgi:uncharacterized membrane protein